MQPPSKAYFLLPIARRLYNTLARKRANIIANKPIISNVSARNGSKRHRVGSFMDTYLFYAYLKYAKEIRI